MVGYYAKRSHSGELQKLSMPISSGMWIDAPNISDAQLNELITTHGLVSNIADDVKDKQELSRVEFSGTDAYVFIRMPLINTNGRLTTHPVLCIVHASNFLTVSTKTTVVLDQASTHLAADTTKQPMDALLAVAWWSITEYEAALKHTERSIDDTGARLRNREITNQDFIHFVIVEDNLATSRMNLSGISAALKRLHETSRTPLTGEQLEILDDITLYIQQLLAAVESYSGRVESIRNAYSTVANNTLNQRMKTLTVFTVMITLPNVVYGMYGMNVAGLPFHDSPWAYWFVFGLSMFITLGIFLVAKIIRVF